MGFASLRPLSNPPPISLRHSVGRMYYFHPQGLHCLEGLTVLFPPFPRCAHLPPLLPCCFDGEKSTTASPERGFEFFCPLKLEVLLLLCDCFCPASGTFLLSSLLLRLRCACQYPTMLKSWVAPFVCPVFRFCSELFQCLSSSVFFTPFARKRALFFKMSCAFFLASSLPPPS